MLGFVALNSRANADKTAAPTPVACAAWSAEICPESIRTTANVTLEKTDAGFTVTLVHLDVMAKIPGAEKEKFETAANNAKAGCPISRLLNTKITMEAKLEA